jgi:hypothetical protein
MTCSIEKINQKNFLKLDWMKRHRGLNWHSFKFLNAYQKHYERTNFLGENFGCLPVTKFRLTIQIADCYTEI